MTYFVYPDCYTISPNGKFRLEARSPENVTVEKKGNAVASVGDDLTSFIWYQRDFRYRLAVVDTASPDSANFGQMVEPTVWERLQEEGEDSPGELAVSDDGWSILRLHGCRPEVIAVSPQGIDVLRVRIGGAKEDPLPCGGNRYFWRAMHIHSSRRGERWTRNSWRYFFDLGGVKYFAWITCWGQRLVLDLTHETLLGEVEQREARLLHAMRQAETEWAYSILSELADQATEVKRLAEGSWDTEKRNPLFGTMRHAEAAIHLAGIHRAVKCVPLLRSLEDIDCAGIKRSISTMGSCGWAGGGWVEIQNLRPILHHTLRLLGEEPQGYAAYRFTKNDLYFPAPEHVRERRMRAAELNLGMNAERVLELLGSPDHLGRSILTVGRSQRVTEDWEYDFRTDGEWSTLRISWDEDKMVRFEEIPSPWLHSDQRARDILRW